MTSLPTRTRDPRCRFCQASDRPYCPGCAKSVLAVVLAERDGYRHALEDLLEEARDMRAYVPDYFAQKWKHDEALQRAEAALNAEPNTGGDGA